MKHLKYFESSEDDFGFDIDELKYYFTDLEDVGCEVRIRNGSKLVQSESSDLTYNHFNFVKFIKVYIFKNYNYSPNLLKSSDLFKEVIDVTKDRLSDKNLFIADINIDGSSIVILIYKNEDMDKIKKS